MVWSWKRVGEKRLPMMVLRWNHPATKREADPGRLVWTTRKEITFQKNIPENLIGGQTGWEIENMEYVDVGT